jgi:5-methylcytosine-specific restriction endonuclease McrA
MLTWQFESELPYKDSLKKAKEQLEDILETNPQGLDFSNFSVQLNITKLKEKKKLIHLHFYNPDDIFSKVTDDEEKKEFIVGDITYKVRMNSQRYHVFKKNKKCVSCGLEGTKMILDMNPVDSTAHFNFYGEEDGRLVLMTKDHILAKANGGLDSQDNFQTMCAICNNLKGSGDISLEDCKELRRIYKNPDRLNKKALKNLINKKRSEMNKLNEF